MTAKELIGILKKFPKNSKVYINSSIDSADAEVECIEKWNNDIYLRTK